MKRATNLFNEQQTQQIEKAVAEAETVTACEIVPVVATSSGRYDRSEDIIGLWLVVFTAIGLWILLPRQVSDSGSWGGTSIFIQLLIVAVSIVAAFIIGAVIGNRIGWLRCLFTPQKQMQEEVNTRSCELFFDKRVHHTTDATGILIYVSLFERKAAILADQQVMEKLGQKFVDQLCQQLTSDLQQESPTDAICSVIAEAGKQLSSPFPRKESDINELHNTLVLID